MSQRKAETINELVKLCLGIACNSGDDIARNVTKVYDDLLDEIAERVCQRMDRSFIGPFTDFKCAKCGHRAFNATHEFRGNANTANHADVSNQGRDARECFCCGVCGERYETDQEQCKVCFGCVAKFEELREFKAQAEWVFREIYSDMEETSIAADRLRRRLSEIGVKYPDPDEEDRHD